jgi:hypothetical protein
VLGEGVDITGERGVEAICFADTRGCQDIGRTLRRVVLLDARLVRAKNTANF